MRFIILLLYCLIVILTELKIISIAYVCSKVVPYRRDNITDHYHNKIYVKDPYRWLEFLNSKDTKEFIEKENNNSFSSIENNDKWKKFQKDITNLWDYPKEFLPAREGKYYYSYKNSGLQKQRVLCRQTSLNDTPDEFLDPNPWPNASNESGTISLQKRAFTEDGSIMAILLCESGSEWRKVEFYNTESETAKKLDVNTLDKLKVPCSMAWTHDKKGLFYNGYDPKSKINASETDKDVNQKLYYHHLGTKQEKDILIAEFPENPEWKITAEVSHDGEYLIVRTTESEINYLVYYGHVPKVINGKIPLIQIISGMDAEYEYITNTGKNMVFRTNKDAPNYRIVVINLENLKNPNWDTLIKEHPEDVLKSSLCFDNNKLMVEYFQNVQSTLQLRHLEKGEFIQKVELEEIGTIAAFSAKKKSSELFFKIETFTSPGIIYRYDFSTTKIPQPTVYYEMKINGFDKNDFEVSQISYSVPDYTEERNETEIPMFIVQKKNTSNGPKPCLLYGYGGFNEAEPPFFTLWVLYFISEFNGIYAVANIRGGGEKGKKWHDAGRLLNKQNVFNDFQAAAKYLVDKNYTEPKKLAIHGASNGGLLVGACINQTPDLFGAAIAKSGVFDMLRFHKFNGGHQWIEEYGDPDDEKHFHNLYKYSPLHNVRSPNSTENQYPSTLILAGKNDNNVSPLHSLKFAATLRNAVRDNKFQKNLILLKVYSKAGHGNAGKPMNIRIQEATDIITFLYQALHIKITNKK